VTGPDGETYEVEDLVVTGDRITGRVPGPLPLGNFTITVHSEDRLGNACDTTKTVRVESAILTVSEVHAYPNPFNPEDGDVNIVFNLSKSSEVTVRVYDFAGKFVTTVKNHERVEPGTSVKWGGTASDGTKLANGAYTVRILATDGARTEEANLKVVLWRE
jgi:hypothetical protein